MEYFALPASVAERLRKKAVEEGVSLEDYVLDRLLSEVDPPGRASAYAEAALELLKAAEEELERGDLRQAGEKARGAAALAIKAYAYWREGVRLSSHGELWRYKDKIAGELGDWVHDAWNAANAMHINFYEGWATPESVRQALARVKRLVEEITRKIRP